MADKYKVAAELKKNNPKMKHKEALMIADEVVKIYFDSNCTFDEAIEKAKEVMKIENTNR